MSEGGDIFVDQMTSVQDEVKEKESTVATARAIAAAWASDTQAQLNGRPILAPPDATAAVANAAARAVNRETGCAGPALLKATRVCLFLGPATEIYGDCVADICQTGKEVWALEDVKAKRAEVRGQAEDVVRQQQLRQVTKRAEEELGNNGAHDHDDEE